MGGVVNILSRSVVSNSWTDSSDIVEISGVDDPNFNECSVVVLGYVIDGPVTSKSTIISFIL